MNELALFAGAGGGILGGHLLGWRCVCAVERDAYAAAILASRQNDGCLPPFPIWSDVETFDGCLWRGRVDVISGGFPCQDISTAGKGGGIDGERSGLWREFARIIGEVAPRFVLVENSPALTSRGLGVVLGDLAALGYDARWGVLGAEDAIWIDGVPAVDHERHRIWIAAVERAHADGAWESQQERRFLELWRRLEHMGETCAYAESELWAWGERHSDSAGRDRLADVGAEGDDTERERCDERRDDHGGDERLVIGTADQHAEGADADFSRLEERHGCGSREEESAVVVGNWWATEPDVGRVADGVAHRVDRIRALGNGQVPGVVRLAREVLHGGRG